MAESRRPAGRWVVLGLLGLGVALAIVTQFFRVPGAVPRLRMFPSEAELREPGSVRLPAGGFTHLLVGWGRGAEVPPDRLLLRPAAAGPDGTVLLEGLEAGTWTVALVGLGPSGPEPGPARTVLVPPGKEVAVPAALPADGGRLEVSRGAGGGPLAIRPWARQPLALDLGTGPGRFSLPFAPGSHAPEALVGGAPVPFDPFTLEPGGTVLRSLP